MLEVCLFEGGALRLHRLEEQLVILRTRRTNKKEVPPVTPRLDPETTLENIDGENVRMAYTATAGAGSASPKPMRVLRPAISQLTEGVHVTPSSKPEIEPHFVVDRPLPDLDTFLKSDDVRAIMQEIVDRLRTNEETTPDPEDRSH